MTEANFEAEDVVLTVWKDGTEIWNGAVAEAQKIANDCEISEWTVNKENDKESLGYSAADRWRLSDWNFL